MELPDSIYTVPLKVTSIPPGRSRGGGAVSKENMKLKLNFSGVGGFKAKNLPWWGYRYFLEQHIV